MTWPTDILATIGDALSLAGAIGWALMYRTLRDWGGTW